MAIDVSLRKLSFPKHHLKASPRTAMVVTTHERIADPNYSTSDSCEDSSITIFEQPTVKDATSQLRVAARRRPCHDSWITPAPLALTRKESFRGKAAANRSF